MFKIMLIEIFIELSEMKKRILGYFIKHIKYSIFIEKKNYCFSEQLSSKIYLWRNYISDL